MHLIQPVHLVLHDCPLDVAAVSLEVRMWLHLDLDHEVTSWSTEAGASLLADAEVDSVVDALGDVDGLLDCLVLHALTLTGCAWIANDSSDTIAVAAHLLNHEWTLSDGLEPSTSTCSALALARAWLSLASLASTAEISATKVDSFLGSGDGFHEVNFERENDVFTFLRRFLTSSLSSLALLLPTKELLKFLEYITKWLLTALSWLSTLTELILEALEATEAAHAGSKAAEWITTCLALLVATHTCLIINSLFVIVTKSLICFVDFSKLFFGAFTFIHIGMELLCLLKVCFLNVALVCTPINVEGSVVIFSIQNLTWSE